MKLSLLSAAGELEILAVSLPATPFALPEQLHARAGPVSHPIPNQTRVGAAFWDEF